MEKRINDKQHLFIVIHMLFTTVFLIWNSNNWNNMIISEYELTVFPWVISSFIINIAVFWVVGKINYTDIGFLFMIGSYFFMFGHVIIEVFDLKTTLLWNPSTYFSQQDKLHAATYAIVCLLVFSIFYSMNVNRIETIIKGIGERDIDRDMIYRMGIVFSLIGLISSILTWRKIISVERITGSYASYINANTTGFLDDFSYLLAPGIIYIFSSKKNSKTNDFILLISVLMYYTATMILSGSRKTQIFAMISVLLSYLHTHQKRKIELGKIIAVVLIGLIFLDLIYVIRECRFNLSTIGYTFIDSLKDFKFINSILGETFAETGISFYSVVSVMSTVPSIFPYEFGMTFVRTIPSILPIGWAVGDFFDKASTSYVINRYTKLPVGTSLLADFYWNFGFIGGVFFCLIFAVTLSKITHTLSSKTKDYHYFSILYIVLMGVRAGIFELFRPLMVVVLFPIITKAFFNRRR